MSKKAASRESKKALPPQKVCPKCHQSVHVRTRFCPNCKHAFELKSGRDPDNRKAAVLESLKFVVENLDCLGNEKFGRQIRLQDIVNSPNEIRLELLEILDFQKNSKQFLNSISNDDLERLVAVLKSIFAGWK